jgi:hypothetical protein
MMQSHDSDCAVHNEPAYPAGPCDCGYQAKVEHRWFAWLYRRACNQVEHMRNALRNRLSLLFQKQLAKP